MSMVIVDEFIFQFHFIFTSIIIIKTYTESTIIWCRKEKAQLVKAAVPSDRLIITKTDNVTIEN